MSFNSLVREAVKCWDYEGTADGDEQPTAAVFDRALSDEEVKALYEGPNR